MLYVLVTCNQLLHNLLQIITGVSNMKKLFATLSTILIASALFAVVPSGPQFSLSAQVDGILFHGFTTDTYTSSDDLLAAQHDIEKDASVSGLDLTSNDPQVVGSYAIYTTSRIQSKVTFETTPLTLTVSDDTYYVPYELTYTSSINDKITFIKESVGSADQATTKNNNLNKKADVLKTSDNSTGLRYGILDLSVKFAGSDNVSFGLPEANGDDFYTGTITAMINVD